MKFERSVPHEEAIIIRNGLLHLDDEKIAAFFEKIPLPLKQFKELLSHKPKGKPEQAEYFEIINGKKVLVETVSALDVVDVKGIGKVEISECSYTPEAPSNLSLHLKTKPATDYPSLTGFEAMLIEDGEAEIMFDNSVIAGSIYAAEGNPQIVKLQKGDLIFIRSTVASGWKSVGKNLRLKYVCFEPWDQSFVAPVYK